MKQIQGSVRVKIKEYVHAWSEFLFVLLLVIFNFFPQINHFTILRLYMACKMWKIAALTFEIYWLEDWWKNSIFLLHPIYYSLYNNCTGEHEITKLKRNICFESRKNGTKTSTERHKWKGMTQNGYFQQCTCVNVIYFAPIVTTTYRMKSKKSSTRSLRLEMSVLAKVRAQLLNMLYIVKWYMKCFIYWTAELKSSEL